MARLTPALLAVSLFCATPATADPVDPVDRWAGHVSEASRRFGVPERWIRRVMRAESGGRATLNGRPTTSRAGAMGLMQLMPGTWREMRSLLGLGDDPHDPRDNILAGTAYLRAMYDRFGYPGLFAAYNAGPARYAEHLRGGRRLPAETRAYVTSVAGAGAAPARAPAQVRTERGLFAVLGRAPERPANSDGGEEAAGGIFVPLGSPPPR